MLDSVQILDRATAPGGPLAHIREQAEAEAAQEQAEADARYAEHQAEAEATLTEAANAYKSIRDRRWTYLKKLPAMQDDYRAAQERYRAAQRRARDLGATEDEPVLPAGQPGAAYAERREADAIIAAMRRGL